MMEQNNPIHARRLVVIDSKNLPRLNKDAKLLRTQYESVLFLAGLSRSVQVD